MLGPLYQLDHKATTFLANIFPHTSVFDALFAFFSLEGLSIFVWAIVLLGLILWRNNHAKALVFYFFLSFGITWLLVNVVIKNVVQRDRPWVAQRLDTTVCPNDFSFPSGHASGAFAGAAVFACYDKKRRFMYYAVALLIAYSRVYLYCHYLFDIMTGALLGYIISTATLTWIPYRNNLRQI